MQNQQNMGVNGGGAEEDLFGYTTSETDKYDCQQAATGAHVSHMRVAVLLPLPLAGCYDYRAAVDLNLQIGDFVEVPLGPRRMTGVVWSFPKEAETTNAEGYEKAKQQQPQLYAFSKLKTVLARLDIPPLPEQNRQFVDWLAAYYLAPLGAVLRMAMSARLVFEKEKAKYLISLHPDYQEKQKFMRLTPARRRVIEVLSQHQQLVQSDLIREAEISASVVAGLKEAGLLQLETVPRGGYWPQPRHLSDEIALSSEQKEAAAQLVARVQEKQYNVTVLDGVTGSGKTEVYFEAIAACLAQGQQVLVLLPEIALSAQWLQRFERRFGVRPGEWHSDVSPGRKRDCWFALASGRLKLVVGARSALHLPFQELGLIIVDEEHEASFKQEEGVMYHARDMAVLRGRLAQCPVILASATPSLETTINHSQGRYDHLSLPYRHGSAEMPDVTLIDLLKDKPARQSWLSPPLITEIEKTLARKEQVLLFLNRRGYAPLTLCNHCGYRFQCHNCSTWLVEHRHQNRLECHHCGYKQPIPEECPDCGEGKESFRACGPGVERLAEEVLRLFPDAKMEIVTSETLQTPTAARAFVDRVENHETDLIIGTQIVAKGYHFPDLTLVGVVDADLGLGGGDLRAAERSFQLLHQVAGRAGRAKRQGKVMIQTSNIQEKVMIALADQDRDSFMAAEAELRQQIQMPPFGKLASLILMGENYDDVMQAAQEIAQKAPFSPGITILGPTVAPIAVLRGLHRQRFLVKVDRDVSIQKLLNKWLSPIKLKSKCRLLIDIDPYNFM